MKLVRSFFAFDIDETLRKELTKVIEDLKQKKYADKVKWIAPKNFHVTLCFLGEVPADKVDVIAHTVALVVQNFTHFELRPNKIVLFPSAAHPHAIVLSFPLQQELLQLVKAIEQAVNQCGIKIEDRPYLPHLTLGRLRTKYAPEIAGRNQWPKIIINQIILYRSDKSENGSIYIPLHTFTMCMGRCVS